MEGLHEEPTPDAPRPGDVTAQLREQGFDGAYEESGLGKHRELFENGNTPNINDIDMTEMVPDQVWEAGVSREEIGREIDNHMKRRAAPSH
jgi:hypothetical protein